jgi:senataxin
MALECMAQDMKSEISAMQAKNTSELKGDTLKFKQFLAEFRKLILLIANQISQASSREIISIFTKIETKFQGVEPISSFSYSTFLGNNATQLLSIASDVVKVCKMIADPLMAPQFASEAVASADIVFCTLASSGQSVVRRFLDIDVLLVDEAAQALEPELCIPFSLFPKHLVLVGDPAQLPATLLSVRAQKMQRADSTMKRLMLRCKSPYYMLKTQYRMHPDISQLPNKLFYGNQISDSKHVSSRSCIFNVVNASPDVRRVASFPWLQNYSVVNIVGKEVRKGKSHHASVSNMEEAAFVARLLAFFCVSFPHLDHANQICVITFYTGQVSALKDQIMREATRHDDIVSSRLKRIRVVTVDSFQGSESDIVVLSFVRSNSANNVGFLNDFSRINVATTRAKFLMVAVGNANTLERSGLPYLNSLVTDARVRGKLFESATIDVVISSAISSK